jgi:chromosome segregation ATPase
MRARVVPSLALAASLLASPTQAQTPSVAEIEGALAELSPKAAVASEVRKAQEALERARGTRASGDGRHGQLLERLAQIWTDVARDLLAAIEAEEKAQAAQRALLDTHEQIERERALLEENIARRSRAQTEVKKAQEEAASRPPAPPPKEKGGKGKGGKKGAKK